MRFTEERLELRTVILGDFHRLLCRLDDPLRLAQERRGIYWSGDDMEDSAIRSTEIGCNVSALLLITDDAECRDLLICRNEILIEVLADLGIRQGVHTERLGVVSGEVRIFEDSRKMEHEDELLLLSRLA